MHNPMLREDKEYSLNGYTLKSYQNEMVDFMLQSFQCLNNSQTGTGKTLVSLTACQHCINNSKDLQVIILCPKSALNSFKKELTNMLKQPYSIYTPEETNIVEGARYNIFSYSKVEKLEDWLEQHKDIPLALICDEVHKLKSPKGKTTKQLRVLRPRFNVVYGLTATPLMNDLVDLYHIINFIKPGYFGTMKSFQNNFLIMELKTKYFYGKKIKKLEAIGTKNLDKLQVLVDRVTCGKSLTYNLDFQYRNINLTTQEQMDYMKCAEGLDTVLGETKMLSARLHDLSKIVGGALKEFERPSLCSKEKLLVTSLKEVLDRNESVLIYTEYLETFDRLQRVLEASKKVLNYEVIHHINGAVKLKDRTYIENNMPRKSIVLLTQAGTASINLQKANNIIVYDCPWSVGTTIQLLGRITRMDTEFDMQHVYFLEVNDTIDTYRINVIKSKIALIESIFGEQKTMPKIEEEPLNLELIKKYCLWRKNKRGYEKEKEMK